MSCTLGRLRKLRAAAASSRPTTTSTVPSRPSASSAAFASLVLGVSMPQLSTTTTLPSAALSDRAERRASFTIFLGVFWSYLRGFGPSATPPPANCGDRVEPWRALPVPFWRYGLAPPPDTSERVLVLWVPERRAASWAVTTWCITGTFGCTPKTSSSSSTSPASEPSIFFREMLAMSACLSCHLSGLLDGVAHDDDAAGGAGNRALDEQHVALGVGLDDLEVLGGDLLVAHVARHPLALEHPRREGARADGAGLAVALVVTVRRRLAGEVVTLHHTGEALAPAGAGDVDERAGRDLLDGELLSDLESVDRVEAELDEALARCDARLLVVAGGRLRELLRVAVAVGHLQCGVAVAFVGLDLHDAHRLDAHHRDGDDLVVHPRLRHADLLADDRLLCHGGRFLFVVQALGGSPRKCSAAASIQARTDERAEHGVRLSPGGSGPDRCGRPTRTSIAGWSGGRNAFRSRPCNAMGAVSGFQHPRRALPVRRRPTGPSRMPPCRRLRRWWRSLPWPSPSSSSRARA